MTDSPTVKGAGRATATEERAGTGRAAPVRDRSVLVATLLLGSVLVFGSMFTVSTLQRAYLEKVAAEYAVAASALERELENAAMFGLGVADPSAWEPALHRLRSQWLRRAFLPPASAPERGAPAPGADIRLELVLADGAVAASTLAGREGERVSASLAREIDRLARLPRRLDAPSYLQGDDRLEVILPIRDVAGDLAASLVISVDRTLSSASPLRLGAGLSRFVLVTMLGGIAVVAVLLRRACRDLQANGPGIRRRLLVAVFGSVVVFQTLATGLSVLAFKYDFFLISRALADRSISELAEDLEPSLAMGLQLTQLGDLESRVRSLMDTNPGLLATSIRNEVGEAVVVFDRAREAHEGQVARLAARHLPPAYTSLGYDLSRPLWVDGKVVGVVSARLADWTLYQSLHEVAMQAFMVLIVASLFAGELIILVVQYLRSASARARSERVPPMTFHIMRPILFFFLFGIDISLSFVPLHMEVLYEPLFGLTKEVVMGLPISMEFLCVGIAILGAGVWMDRRGWHEPLLGGVVLAALGVLYSFAAPDALHFILSRAVVGLGFGLVLIACQGFVIDHTADDNRTHGLAHLFAGLYAGSICGGAVGALLADQLGYETVFLVGFCVLAGVFAYVCVFMRSAFTGSPSHEAAPARAVPMSRALAEFFLDRKVVCLTFFSSLPAAVAVVGYLNYFSPIYLNRIGASQTTIGQIMLIYGISLVLVGPYISRRVDRSSDKRYAIFFGSVLGALALLSFQFLGGVLAAAVGMLLLGISSSFILASQSSYLLSLEVTKRLGKGVGIGIFRATSRVGQMAGPLVFGVLIAVTGMRDGIALLGAAYLALAVVFLVLSASRWPWPRVAGGFAERAGATSWGARRRSA